MKGCRLPPPFSRNREDWAHLVECVIASVGRPIAQSQDLPLAIDETLQYVGEARCEHLVVRVRQRVILSTILDDLAKNGIIPQDGPIEGERFAAVPLCLRRNHALLGDGHRRVRLSHENDLRSRTYPRTVLKAVCYGYADTVWDKFQVATSCLK